jgi:uncharacterized protein YlxP (DUF503 family)
LNFDAELDKIGVENVRMSLANNISISNIDRAHIWEWAVAGIAAVIIGLIGLK